MAPAEDSLVECPLLGWSDREGFLRRGVCNPAPKPMRAAEWCVLGQPEGNPTAEAHGTLGGLQSPGGAWPGPRQVMPPPSAKQTGFRAVASSEGDVMATEVGAVGRVQGHCGRWMGERAGGAAVTSECGPVPRVPGGVSTGQSDAGLESPGGWEVTEG